MTKAEILYEIGLNELIKTKFEDMITIKKINKRISIHYKQSEMFNTYFILKGKTRHTINTPEGGKFYRDFFSGEIPGLNFSLSIRKAPESFRLFDVEIIFEEGSLIAYLPLEKVIDLEFKDKCKVLEKIIMMGMEDHFKEFNNLLLKSIYSDKEFFIKYLEKYKKIDIDSSKKLSEHLNINLRTLQRILKDLLDKGIVDKIDKKVSIKDQYKLDRYKAKFKR